ncbi:Zn finger protein [Scheffersomyces stipitis CBS 6054]|uniref:Zn finger protein n=1 Tax=Scheffersomyces stipitis (strain ATCC 58785 / CBS 6054 / NBRC 10063 / NRRL Y-11545) TaxID=322104 RepID=A3LRN3_PICST|nr:Zn finger protein [Scheffersomyces stipitis CBS 6054]ABN65416.2 Zn finger protein [Scheffersomyces stipitis CBS 6054]
MSTPPSKQPKFTLASPEKDSSDDEPRENIATVLDETNTNLSNLSNPNANTNPDPTNNNAINGIPNVNSNTNGNITATNNSPINIITDNNNVNSDSVESPADDENGNENKLDGSDLSFTKKDPRKSRTQSFQSVLSTASLKSLKQQALASVPTNNNVNIGTRSSSISHNNLNNLHSNSSNSNPNINATASRNFQSFIQAPVLSSITNLKMEDDIEIGQQLPFTESKVTSQRSRDRATSSTTTAATTNAVSLTNTNATSTVQSKSASDHDEEYEDTIVQQQKLTLNALKKLSLSPMPINTADNSLTRRPLNRASSKPKIDIAESSKESINSSTSAPGSKTRTQEPYQPAEVDLSSFASLTRQPKVATEKLPSPGVASASTSAVTGFGERDSSIFNPNTSTTSNPDSIPTGTPSLSQKRSLPSLPEGEQFVENVATESNAAVRSNSGDVNQTYQHHPQAHQGSQQQYQHSKQDSHHMQLGNRIPSAVVPPQNMNTRRVPSGGFQAPNVYNSHMASQTQQNPHLHYPKANRQLQQIKGFRSPMYVPAVLRMSTLSTVSPTNSNTSGSNPNSPNELSTSPKNGTHYEHDHLNLNEPAATPRSSSRASVKSFDSGISVESSSSTTNQPGSSPFLSLLGKNGNPESYIFRAPPTRKHWVKDEAVLKCGMPFCSKVFNFFERRHHCRKCGGIYCKEHTSHYLYINHLAQFTTGGRGTLSKVCDLCIEEYNDFIQHEFGVNIAHSSSENSSYHSAEHIARTANSNTISNTVAKGSSVGVGVGSAVDTVGPRKDTRSSQTPNPQYLRNGINPGKSHLIGVNANDETNQRSEQAVGSVPANWSWSSF